MKKNKSLRPVKHSSRKKSLISLLLSIVFLVLINIVGSYLFYRVDLTQEKRYTLSENTRTMLKELDDIVYFQIFLEGDLPVSYKRLRNATKEMLDEFRAYSKSNIQYEFVDPAEGKDKKTLNDFYEQLRMKGLEPSIDMEEDQASASQKIIWPGAIVTYRSREVALQLLTTMGSIPASNKEALINNSIQSLEFNIADAIRKLTIREKPKVAFIEDGQNISRVQLADIEKSLNEYYKVEHVFIDQQLKSLDSYKAVIIAKPDSAWDEKNKFILDQYIMKGGRVLWLVDGIKADMDSLQSGPQTVGIANEVNLDDMLFKYGVRINYNVVMDLNSCPIPVKTGQIGDQPQFDFFNWFFFPAVAPQSENPIVRNLNAIRFEFASGIDTVGAPGVKKTILLTTSAYARIMNTPAIISLDMLRENPSRKMFNKANIPLGVLLEGTFNSVFSNRIPPEIEQDPDIDYRESSVPNRMIVISDGDIIKNQFLFQNGSYMTYPLGYDRYSGIQYGNKDLILNCLNYLTDDSNLLSIRSREVKIRLLDKTLVNDNRIRIQLVNVLAPIISVVLFGLLLTFLRRRKHQSRQK